jgi:hypothetical protein
MVSGNYRDFFVVIATSAATLIGLLFVAMSVAQGRARKHAPVIREFRAAAALFAFTNSFTVSLFGLVPGSNIGYPAVVVSLIGILFTAAGLRTTLSLPGEQQHRRPQFALIFGLLAVFGFELFGGIELIQNSQRRSALDTLGYVLVASLLIGIGRSWELVGDRDTGLLASIGVLIGHDPTGSAAATGRTGKGEGTEGTGTPVAPRES